VPILGGTTGGQQLAAFGEREVYDKGVPLAAIYADLPVGWTFEAGFGVPDKHSGIVTKVERRALVEIDNRPSLDVHDEWFEGHIGQLAEKSTDPASIRELLTLPPPYRKCTAPSGQHFFLFSHPWPRDDFLKIRSVTTSTKIKGGKILSQLRVMADFSQQNWESPTKGKAQRRDWHRQKAPVSARHTIRDKPILEIADFVINRR
jgi:hypothetical protein